MTLADNAGLGKTRGADTQHWALRETLRLAVPMWMHQLRDLTPRRLQELAVTSGDAVAAHGDDLQFGGQRCATAFNALARGLAAGALCADGGVDFAGLHWCAQPGCRAATRFDHAADEPPQAA